MLESRIYVGLNDRDSREQKYDTEQCRDMLKTVCKDYSAPFSLQVIEGGYFHDDGSWVEENSLLVTLIGIPRKTVYMIAKDLCTLFHQETVMITGTSVRRFNIRDYSSDET